MTGGGVPRAKNIEYVIIEEPEMGLHPYAICTVMYIIMELIRRGYKVIISTHSPATLDIAWAIGRIKELNPKNKSDLFL